MEKSEIPSDRVTAEVVRVYVEQLKLPDCAEDGSFQFGRAQGHDEGDRARQRLALATDICNQLNRNAEPIRDKRSRMLSSGKIYRTAIKRMDALSRTDLKKRVQIVGFRNCLMLALMTACPLRLKNFASLEIEKNFVKLSEGWLIKIPSQEVKNRQAISFDVPARLLPYLDTYLSAVRSQLTQNRAGLLWVAWDGTSLKYHSVYIAFTRISRELFGSSINPHLLRSCAATALASDSYKAAQAARGLLGHRRFETTEKYYIHAQQLEASRKINDVLSNALAAPTEDF